MVRILVGTSDDHGYCLVEMLMLIVTMWIRIVGTGELMFIVTFGDHDSCYNSLPINLSLLMF